MGLHCENVNNRTNPFFFEKRDYELGKGESERRGDLNGGLFQFGTSLYFQSRYIH
jgi:hypothetical protein